MTEPLFEIPALVTDEPDDVWEGDLADEGAGFQGRAATAGAEFKHLALEYLLEAGATIVERGTRHGPYPVDAIVSGPNGTHLLILAHGTPDDGPESGLRRTDTVKKLACDAIQLARRRNLPILAVTSHLPAPDRAAARYLADLGEDLFDVVATQGDLAGFQRLRRYLHDRPFPGALRAPWRSGATPSQLDLFDVLADIAVGVDDADEPVDADTELRF